jgi:hypothetical protein
MPAALSARLRKQHDFSAEVTGANTLVRFARTRQRQTIDDDGYEAYIARL